MCEHEHRRCGTCKMCDYDFIDNPDLVDCRPCTCGDLYEHNEYDDEYYD